ncbi:hypothetical protein H5410_037698 [Solanum commersonii]|uniref:Uncharacterized protein n=1 Tax=Solanum commersonii TaxID=4109 RepID=A0A9J5Y8Q0_SOLCO|nr:hypothetical protein H5410_037698 [Solanum commersonii]
MENGILAVDLGTKKLYILLRNYKVNAINFICLKEILTSLGSYTTHNCTYPQICWDSWPRSILKSVTRHAIFSPEKLRDEKLAKCCPISCITWKLERNATMILSDLKVDQIKSKTIYGFVYLDLHEFQQSRAATTKGATIVGIFDNPSPTNSARTSLRAQTSVGGS